MKKKRPRRKARNHFMTVRSQIYRIGTNPMFTGSWDKPAARAYRAAVDANLGSLMNGVSLGQVSAIELLLDIVRAGIECVNKSALRHIGTYVRLAERRNVWPVIVTPHPDSFAAAQAFVQLLRLGTRTGVGYMNRKAFTLKDEREIVLWLYIELSTSQNFRKRFAIPPDERWDRLVSKLPVLSRNKTVISAWWKPIWLLFKARYGPAFESNPAFARHWTSPSFAPKGLRGDSRRHANQRSAAWIYAELMGWWQYACCGRRSPRVVWHGYDPSAQAADYPQMLKGSWQRAAVRLPKLTHRGSVMDEWFEVARLLNRDPDSEYFETLSNADFAPYMENALGRTREIRKHIKDLLEQALTSIATDALESEVRGTLKR